jgi:hypothetical protein
MTSLWIALVLGCGEKEPGEASETGDTEVTETDEPVDTSTDETGDAGDTWANFAGAWVDQYCVQCHASGDNDYTAYAAVQSDLDVIACGVSLQDRDGCGAWPGAGGFPAPGAMAEPSDEERARLVAWIDAGAPE